MKPLHVHVEEEHHEWVYQQPVEKRTSMSDVIRRLICEKMLPKERSANEH